MRFVWNTKPGNSIPIQSSPDKPKEEAASKEKLLWDRGRMEAAKLFNESFQKRKTDTPRMETLRKNLDQWNSPKTEAAAKEYIELMRRGGVTEADNLKNFYERHVRLASAYLIPLEGEQYSYEFQFGKDKVAYWRVGAADILPHCFNVCVFNTRTQGANVLGVRTRNPATGREGFYRVDDLKAGQYTYIPVFDGDRAKLATQDIITSTLEDLRVNAKISPQEKSTLSAYTGTKANMASHVGIYKEGAAQDDHSDSSELLYDPVSKKEYPDALSALKARREAAKNRSQKDMMELRKAMAPPELRNLTGVRKDIVANARRYLQSQNQNYFKENYYDRDPKYRGGELGCAITVTHILKESGSILNKSASVAGTEAELIKCGWTKKTISEAMPGDVVVWDRTPSVRFKHIGIITRNGYALNNSSKEGIPIESPISDKRPITAIYSPPNIEERAAKRAESAPAAKRASSKPERYNKTPSNVTEVLKDHPDWNRWLDESLAFYNIPKEYKYIFLYVMRIESSFNPSARPIKNGRRLSSAYGLAQTLDSSWNSLQKQMHKNGIMPGNEVYRNGEQPVEYQIKSLVTNVVDIMKSANLRLSHDPKEIAKIYLCYHDGIGGYKRALKPWLDANGGNFVHIPDESTNRRYMRFDFQLQRGARGTNQILDYAYNNARNIATRYRGQLQGTEFV